MKSNAAAEFPYQDALRLSTYFLGRSLGAHPDFEDIRAELLTEVWKSWAKHGSKWSLTTYVKVLAPQAISQWFRSPRGRHCYWKEPEEWQEEAEGDQEERLSLDFTDEVIDQVYAERVWSYVWDNATERQRKALYLVYRQELSTREAADRLGIWQGALRSSIGTALDKYRRRYGLPIKTAGG